MNAPPRREQDGAHDGAPPSTQPATPTATPAPTAPDWPQEDSLAADGAGPGGGARRLTRRHLALAALGAVACAVVAVVLVSGGHGKGGAPATGVPAGDTTATVARRTLTESSTVDGTLGYGSTLELYDRLSGTFTWLPSVGATIARGGTLFRINNLPVVLLYGTVPVYRTLEVGVGNGPDVAQLNRNLIDLGYDPYGAITDVEDFSEATAAAVRRWQKAEGLPETGKVELGRVVFAPSARRVTSVHVTLGQDPPGAESPPADTGGDGAPKSSPNSSKGNKQPPADKTPTNKGKPKSHKPNESEKDKPSGGEKPKEAGKPKEEDKPKEEGKPKEQGKPATSEPNEGTAHDASNDSPAKEGEGKPSKKPEGGAEGAGEAVLSTTSVQQLVQVKLKAEQQQLAHVGERAPVTLPGGSVVQGTIIKVSTVASEAKGGEGGEKGGSSGEGSGESTIPVTLALAHRAPRLDKAPVSVELVKSVRRNVLAVPATALTATAGGGYAVELLEGDRRSQLAVTPGMFANGYVQVEGSGLHEGQTVIESE